jgi:hypothetical protein
LPTLQRVIELRNHFFVVETLLEQEQIPLTLMKVKTSFLETLVQHSRLHMMACDLFALPWEEFRRNLIGCFASPVAVRSELDRRLSALRFERSSDHSTFPNDIRTLFQFYSRAESEMVESDFVKLTFSALPGTHLAELIRECNFLHPGRCWNKLPTLTLCDILEAICFVRGQIETALPQKKPRDQRPDAARRVHGDGTGGRPPTTAARPSDWISALVRKHRHVFYVNGFTEEQIARVSSAALECHQVIRKKGGSGAGAAYYVAAFSDASTAQQALSGTDHRQAEVRKN